MKEELLQNFPPNGMPLEELAERGHYWMKKARIHHHFFTDHSLKLTALHLTLFALGLPYEYENKTLLQTLVGKDKALRVLDLFEKRILNRTPVAYLTQEASYLNHSFYVNEHVLVPRSLMSTRFTDFMAMVPWHNHRVLDLCAGSGCIGISLALMNPTLQVDLAELSPKALEVAHINIQKHGLSSRVRCIASDLFENIQGKYDLIITNPPYVSTREYKHQPQEIRNEPEMALLAGNDGLLIIEKILKEAKSYLSEHGLLIAEVGYPAAKLLKKKYRKIRFKWYNFRETTTPQSWIGSIINWIGYPDGVFVCTQKDLPYE